MGPICKRHKRSIIRLRFRKEIQCNHPEFGNLHFSTSKSQNNPESAVVMGSPICWNHRSHSVQGVHMLGIWCQFGAKAAVFFPSKSEEQWPTKESHYHHRVDARLRFGCASRTSADHVLQLQPKLVLIFSLPLAGCALLKCVGLLIWSKSS